MSRTESVVIRIEAPAAAGQPPSLPATERPSQRKAVVPVRLTPGERDQLLAVARDMGLSLSGYIRQAVFSRPLPPRRVVRPIPEVNRQTYHALGEVAGLLNQLARCLSEGRSRPEAAEVLKAVDVVGRLVSTVRAELLGTSFGGQGTS